MSRNALRDVTFIALGVILQAVSVVMFFNPADLVPGGITGLAVLFNRISPITLPVGIFTLLLNLPLFWLGMRWLGGGWGFLARTVVTTVAYALLTALLEQIGWPRPITNDILLNTLYGAIIGGVGAGLVFRGRATTGGTDILALLLFRLRGISLSQSYVIVDGVVFLLAGFVFGWDKALYAFVANYIGGVAAEGASEGASISRIALVITEHADAVAQAVMSRMGRGVTQWTGTGKYTNTERPILLIVVGRAELSALKAIVREVDPDAFFVIGQAQEVFGEGFKPINH